MHPYCVLTLSKYDDQLDRLIANLIATHPMLKTSDIYVVDDGLKPTTKAKWKVNYIEGIKPFVFSQNFNIGIRALPKSNDVFFIGDDCYFVTPHGIDLLAKQAYKETKIGMAGPSIIGGTANRFQHFNSLKKPTKYSNILHTKIEELKDVEKVKPEDMLEILLIDCFYTLPFNALYIKKEVINLVGPIPDSFAGCGFEDNFYSYRMIQAGYDWIIDPAVVVMHQWLQNISSSSYKRSKQDLKKLTEINQKAFREYFTKKHL